MIRKEIIIDQPVERVWEALTQPEEMKNWYFNISNFEPKEEEIFDFIVSFTDRKSVV